MVKEKSGAAALINQGDISWIQPEEGDGSQGEYAHPYVVIQEDVINHSRVLTVVVCALTSNVKRASWPGNVLLEAGEGNLPRQSVVEVSKVSSRNKAQLGEYIGSLDMQRVKQIISGMRLLESSHFNRRSFNGPC